MSLSLVYPGGPTARREIPLKAPGEGTRDSKAYGGGSTSLRIRAIFEIRFTSFGVPRSDLRRFYKSILREV